MEFVCSGCQRSFSEQRYLIQHLRKTSLPACLVAHNALIANMRAPVKGARRHQSAASVTQEPAPFQGDFFGNEYHDEDFPFPDTFNGDEEPSLLPIHDIQRSVDEDSEDEDGDQIGALDTLQPGWEPDRSQDQETEPNVAVMPGSDDQHMDVDQAGDGVCIAPGGIQPDVHDRLRSPPVHIDHFGSKAGIPVIDEPPPIAAYHQYEQSIGDDGNEWAPFSSRMDWEVARWAKLRGLGSTAFTDLLNIEGVGILYNIPMAFDLWAYS